MGSIYEQHAIKFVLRETLTYLEREYNLIYPCSN